MAEDTTKIAADIYYLTNALANFRADIKKPKPIRDKNRQTILSTLRHVSTLLTIGTLSEQPDAAKIVAVTARTHIKALDCSILIVNKGSKIELEDLDNSTTMTPSGAAVVPPWKDTTYV